MTGSGRASARLKGRADSPVSVFVRSINHKGADFHFRSPPALQALYPDVMRLLRAGFSRGRIDLEILGGGELEQLHINRHLAAQYLEEARRLLGRQLVTTDMAAALQALQLPGVARTQPGMAPASQADLLALVGSAAARLKQSRLKEGRRIQSVLRRELRAIAGSARKLAPRLRRFKAERLRAFKRDTLPQLTTDRSPKEIERGLHTALVDWYGQYSITEELDRLLMHLSAIGDELKVGGEIGKRVEFYAQELLREANTIGSKCPDFAVRSLVVDIKSNVENLREQARNIC